MGGHSPHTEPTRAVLREMIAANRRTTAPQASRALAERGIPHSLASLSAYHMPAVRRELGLSPYHPASRGGYTHGPAPVTPAKATPPAFTYSRVRDFFRTQASHHADLVRALAPLVANEHEEEGRPACACGDASAHPHCPCVLCHEVPGPLDHVPPALMAIVRTLPPTGSTWPAAERERFMAAFVAVLDWCYPPDGAA